MPGKVREALGTVAVGGDGPVAFAAAIALRRALPQSNVVLVPASVDPAALADRAVTALPQSNAFHRRLGIEEEGLVVRAGASHRIAVTLAGWTGGESVSLHPYGAAPPDGIDMSANPAISAALAAEDRFAHPADERASPLSDIDYALRFNPAAYRRHLAALATRIGIVCHDAELVAAIPDDIGGIAHLKLADGNKIAADLFVDCTGPRALIAGQLPPQDWQSWAHILPCDRVLQPDGPRTPELSAVDRITATAFGWRTVVHGRDGTHSAFAASSAIGSVDELAIAAGFEPASTVAIEPGRRAEIWQANVISFGDAAAQFEPLHWLNLSLAHAQIELFLELLPGRWPEPLERAEFNRRAGAMADRVRDYIALHYCAPRGATGRFWTRAAGLQRPDSLCLTLAEYVRRGRLPFFEEELLSRDAWQFALTTIAVRPGPAARLLAIPPATMNALAQDQRTRAAAAVGLAQPYPQWLASYLKAIS